MTPSDLVNQQINSFPDWRGELMTKLHTLVKSTDPDLKLEWKWGTGVYTKNGLVLAISAFKDHVKINFFKGAFLKDPHKLINAGLESRKNKSIDFHQNDQVNESNLSDLITEAINLNT